MMQGYTVTKTWENPWPIEPIANHETFDVPDLSSISGVAWHSVGNGAQCGDADGSECERTAAAQWCHARDEVLAKGTSEEWSRSLCRLEAGHDGPHSFETAEVPA